MKIFLMILLLSYKTAFGLSRSEVLKELGLGESDVEIFDGDDGDKEAWLTEDITTSYKIKRPTTFRGAKLVKSASLQVSSKTGLEAIINDQANFEIEGVICNNAAFFKDNRLCKCRAGAPHKISGVLEIPEGSEMYFKNSKLEFFKAPHKAERVKGTNNWNIVKVFVAGKELTPAKFYRAKDDKIFEYNKRVDEETYCGGHRNVTGDVVK